MKKILIVSHCPTHPVNAGNRKFINDMAELLKKMGAEVFFLYIKEFSFSRKETLDEEAMNVAWGNHLYVYKIPFWVKMFRIFIVRFRWYFGNEEYHCDDYYPFGLGKYIRKINEKIKFDACFVNYYFLSKLFLSLKVPVKVLVTHDCFAYKNALLKRKRLYLNTNAYQEAVAMQRSPFILALNEEEKNYFQRLAPNSKVLNVFCFLEYHSQKKVGNKNILFLSGNNQYNVEGFLWFLENVFPLIVRKWNDAKLIVGGKICEVLKEMNLPQKANIDFKGRVDDVGDFFSRGDVCINPTFSGTGLKIKTFECLSYSKITLVHPHSKIGIYKPESAPIFSSENPEEWISFLEQVFDDENFIGHMKDRIEKYMLEMQAFVKKQYALLLEKT